MIIGATITVGCLFNLIRSSEPVKAILYSTVLNGIVTIPLIMIRLLICNNGKIISNRYNRLVSNITGQLTVVLMGVAAGFMIWTMVKG